MLIDFEDLIKQHSLTIFSLFRPSHRLDVTFSFEMCYIYILVQFSSF